MSVSTPEKSIHLEAEVLYQSLLRHVRGWLVQVGQPVQLVGIASGGVWLAQRLRADLGLDAEPGVVSSALHRDDFARRGLASSVQTRLGFDVNGTHVLLLDDVLYTGRTIRAVLNELFDHGRPASVSLMVLVDRDGRQLPIEAAWSAARITLPADRSLQLARDEQGRFSFALDTVVGD
ncbi:MAG TPA: bifunctional pyr operon transcriptional regulator/uracil phosphoribosyltransferase PyrR [Burkholderiaceae bacterium]|nr:bifunctional pyr operon transcriptional regulator/uracil phosphoribosyltransferase PyrR [Burkholderiaceae bacterium]